METNREKTLKTRVDQVRILSSDSQGSTEWFESAMLSQSILYDTVGGSHPLMNTIKDALEKRDWDRCAAASRALIRLFDTGGLVNPRLVIAHEIEGSLLDLAQSQVELAEKTEDSTIRQIYLSVASFLCGATLEDALRRLCDARGIQYDSQHTSISKLQSILFQPSNQVEVISSGENKQITAWGETRNKAGHGRFSEITYAETLSMVVGVRGFIDKHLP